MPQHSQINRCMAIYQSQENRESNNQIRDSLCEWQVSEPKLPRGMKSKGDAKRKQEAGDDAVVRI
ncbi:hypothetical protein [Haloferax elongans]|uniref:hypothetical protein n=1 Tax=Haloferax elongans TaxID=403191 RepID=UPI000677D9C1|nr:hypothetical protein [Haloferax elongans]